MLKNRKKENKKSEDDKNHPQIQMLINFLFVQNYQLSFLNFIN